MFFPVLLWFVPILILNLGYEFLTKNNLVLEQQQQNQQAQMELQSMAATSDFSFQFARHAGNFNYELKQHTESIPLLKQKIDSSRATKFLTQLIEKSEHNIFQKPFPEYELFVFHIPANKLNTPADAISAKDFLIHSTPKITSGVSAIGQSFQYLVNVYEDYNTNSRNPDTFIKTDESRKKLLNTFLNTPLIDVDVIAKTQRGKPSYCLYKKQSQRFMWNYFKSQDNSVYGFFLFCQNTQDYEENARVIALKNFKEEDKTGKNRAAFIPIIDGYGGPLYSDDTIANSALFQNWIKKNIPKTNEELRKWNLKDPLNKFRIGNYTGYSYIGKSQTHLSIVLVPRIVMPTRPMWLNAISITVTILLLFVLIRGLLLNKWPSMGLKTRFTVSYIWACFFPVSLLIILLYAYIVQYEQSRYFQGISYLQNCVSEFDTRKNQLLEGYRAFFQSVMVDKELLNALKEGGTLSPKVLPRLRALFEAKSPELPVISVTLFDEGGDGCSLKFNQSGIVASEAEFILSQSHSKEELSDTKSLKNIVDKSISNMIIPITQTLRKQKQEAGVNLKESPVKISDQQQELLEEGFASISGESLSNDIESRRGVVNITNLEGDEVFVRFHDFIKVDSNPFCTIIVRWNDEALDQKTYAQTETMLILKNSDYVYASFHNSPEGLVPLTRNRHISKKQFDKMFATAKDAAYRKSESRLKDDKSFYFAAPSKRYKDIIFVGVGGLDNIVTSIQVRQLIFWAILFMTALVIVACNYISIKTVLEPVEGLKKALDNITAGKLSIEIIGNSQDEFGQLSHEISMMTQGLRERERLATLISDQAVEAIGSSDFGEFTAESFKGVVLVSDIRNFTGTCESYPATLITAMLNEHFAEMTKIISEQGGRIYKYIGDAIEAVFPEDSRLEESASKRAFNASSRMIIKLHQINKKRRKSKLFTYKIGIGLRYGQLHSGTVGSLETRMDYAILGEPLQTAAELESLSVNTPAFPLVVDEYVCNELTANGLSFKPIPDSRIPSFILSDLGENNSNNVQSSSNKDEHKENASEQKKPELFNKTESFSKIYANSNLNNISPGLAFVIGLMFIGLIGIGSYIGYYVSKNTKIDSYKRIAAASNLRLAEQFRINNIQKYAFENGCRKLFTEYEKILNNGADEKALKACIEKHDKIMEFKRILFFAAKKRETGGYVLDTTYNRNFAPLSSRAINLSLFYKIDENLDKVFSNGMQKLRTTYCSTAFQSVVNDFGNETKPEQEYVFWDYFYDHKCMTSGGLNGAIGCAIITCSVSQFNSSPQKFVNCYSDENENVQLAVKNASKKDSKWYHSVNFPKETIINYENGTNKPTDKFELLSDRKVLLNNDEYKLLIVRTLPQDLNKYGKTTITCFFIILAISVFFLFQTVRGKSFINKSISAKMWLNLVCIAIIPIITLIFIFQLYLNEQESTDILKTQTELQNFATNFEYKATFLDLSGWKKIENISKSPELIAAVEKTERTKSQNDNKDITINQDYVRNAIQKELSIKEIDRDYAHVPVRIGKSGIINDIPNPENFIIKEYVISGTDWKVDSGIGDKVASESNNDKTLSQFSQILGILAKRQTQIIHKSKSPGLASNISGDFYAEMAIDVVKNLFGTNMYIRLPHAFTTPTLFKITEMTIGVVVHAAPAKLKVPYTSIWMVIFDRAFANIANEYNTYHSNMTKLDNSLSEYDSDDEDQKTKFRIYPTDSVCFGTLKPDINIAHSQHLKKLASQVSAAGIAMSSRLTSGNEDIFFEARPCVELPEFVTVSIAGTSHMIDKRQKITSTVYKSLGLSFLAILAIAWSIVFSILSPIHSLMEGVRQAKNEQYSYRINLLRDDELGELCNAFDNMMKGLEEKQVMSKMISSTAQKVTLKEHEDASRTVECVLLYVSIPKFNNYIESMQPNRLLENLKKQVSQIAQSVTAEGGEIDKIIGDKQLIAFHKENKKLEDCLYAACRAGLRIINDESLGKLAFPVAIGIEYGYVVSGFIGVGNKRDFTVIGNPVNSAARIASQAEKQSIERLLISENVYNLVKTKFGGNLIGEIALKGKEKPMKIYHLVKDNRIQQ